MLLAHSQQFWSQRNMFEQFSVVSFSLCNFEVNFQISGVKNELYLVVEVVDHRDSFFPCELHAWSPSYNHFQWCHTRFTNSFVEEFAHCNFKWNLTNSGAQDDLYLGSEEKLCEQIFLYALKYHKLGLYTF